MRLNAGEAALGVLEQDLAVVLATGQCVVLVMDFAVNPFILPLVFFLVGEVFRIEFPAEYAFPGHHRALGLERCHELLTRHLGQRHQRLQVAVFHLGLLVARLLAQLGHELLAGAFAPGGLDRQPFDG